MQIGRPGTKTYCATAVAADGTIGVVELAVLVTALIAETVTLKLNIEVKSLGGGRGVGEDGEELSRLGVTDTKVDRSPVTDVLAAVTPLTTLLSRHTLGVDVVLSGGDLALPEEVFVTIGASELVDSTRGRGERNGLGLGTGVISTANRNAFGHLVLDVDTTDTRNAKLLIIRVGEVELVVGLTLKATNGLASATLGGRPLGLLVSRRASVRAHGTVVALIASNGGNDIANHIIEETDVLDTRVTTKTKVVKGDSTILRREVTAVNLSIGEVGIESGGTRAARAGGARRAAGSSGGCSGARGGLSGACRAGGGDGS